MEKLKMESADLTEQNIDKIAAFFPNVITETKDADGNLKKAINFTLLQQMLQSDLVDGDECYEFTWVGKKQSIIDGNSPIRKTLRPCPEESKDWDKTENLYIEGDNLEVLKLLQGSYLNSIKLMYFDPPYNTGNDFVYRDNFTAKKDDYEADLGLYDEDENRLFQNNQSNGRFHSDWCSMMYPRLQLSYNLLSEDGVVFISIDDNEVDNLRKICDEIFGEVNFIANIVWERSFSPVNLKKHFSENHDFLLCYAKNLNACINNGLKRSDDADSRYSNPDNDPRGIWTSSDMTVGPAIQDKLYEIKTPNGKILQPSKGRCWLFTKDRFDEMVVDNRIWFGEKGENMPRVKKFLSEVKNSITPMTIWKYSEVGHSQDAAQSLKKLFNGASYFDYPKPVDLIKRCIELYADKNSIILDFFSGSATTAHAVMQKNAEDGGNRHFIMVQLPEVCDNKSDAFIAGYRNICEIGKERIRRAGLKIKEDVGLHGQNLDTGFRVFKLDSTNMKDVYYGAGEYSQQLLLDLESNIKNDRTDLDLLYGVLLDWGVSLALPHTNETIGDVKVHFVNGVDLVACFADNVNETVIREIAKCKPLRVVFRDSSFANSPDKINVTEIFKTISPETTVKVI